MWALTVNFSQLDIFQSVFSWQCLVGPLLRSIYGPVHGLLTGILHKPDLRQVGRRAISALHECPTLSPLRAEAHVCLYVQGPEGSHGASLGK